MYVNAIEDFAGHFGTVALAQRGWDLQVDNGPLASVSRTDTS